MNLNNITTALKTGITIYQYEQWQNTGSVNLMQKESHMLSKVWLKTNIHNPDSLDKPFIQLSATFTSEFDIQEYNEWLNANQYKLYPLLLDILKISLKDNFYNYSNASNILRRREIPKYAYQELVDQVENEYGYDADKDHVPLHFKTIQDIENYFELVHIETQELTATGFKTAILKEL